MLQQADALNVDAVIHAGDVFDHGAIGSDRSFVTDLLTEQYDRLPFYYIHGNHDAPASRRTLDGATTDHDHIHRLTTEGTTVVIQRCSELTTITARSQRSRSGRSPLYGPSLRTRIS